MFPSRKTSKLSRIFCPCRTHKILGKDRENTKLTKAFPWFFFYAKEIQITKERKDRALLFFLGLFLCFLPCWEMKSSYRYRLVFNFLGSPLGPYDFVWEKQAKSVAPAIFAPMNFSGDLVLVREFLFHVLSVVIFFSLTELLPDPTPTPPSTPKRTQNRPGTELNGAETEPNGAEMDRNQAFRGGTAGGLSG